MPAKSKIVPSKGKKVAAKDGTVKKRRSPITRTEGERRLIEAAITLTRATPFSEVGVREIAALADVNHGFVHTWFGSKNDLLIRVVSQLLAGMVTKVEDTEPGAQALNPLDPDVRLAVRLLIWLELEGIDAWAILENLPIVQALEDRYVKVEGLTPKDAYPAAIQAVAVGIAASTFSRVLSHDPERVNEDFLDILVLWRHILGLLAQHPRA
jgi:AcrR family transcriptional regulator